MAEQQQSWLMAEALQEMRALKERLAKEDAAVRPRSMFAEGRPTLTCACCGTRYTQGFFRCCAPPGGQSVAAWSDLWHADCPTSFVFGPGKRRCPRHCGCERKGGKLTDEARKPFTIEETKAAVEEIRTAVATGQPSSLVESLFGKPWLGADDEKT